jgi:hypothetical protein
MQSQLFAGLNRQNRIFKRLNYNVTLRKLNAQLTLSDGVVAEYVPLTFSGAVVAPDDTELAGKVRVTVVLVPGARFVTGVGADSRDPVPNVVPAIVTCKELIVTLPVFEIVTFAT